MPVVFAPPDPVAPQISSAYGAAQQWSQDFPTLERQQQGIISANEGARNLQAQARAQANAQQQQALAQSAQNALHAEMYNQGQEQQQQQFVASRQPSERDAFQVQAQMAENAQKADLQNWLGQQDLSQKETMRLQQMQSAIADVQSSSLPEDQKQDAIMQLRSGIDPLKARQQASQTKHLDAQTQMVKSQQELEAQKIAITAKVASSSKEDQTKTEVDPNFEEQISAELGPVQPTGSAMGDILAQQQRQALIRQKAGAAGKLITSRMQKDGTWQPDKHVDNHADFEQKRFDAESKFFLQREQRWEEDYTKAQDRVRKHLIDAGVGGSQPDLATIQDLAMKEMRPRPTPPAPMRAAGTPTPVPAPAPTPGPAPTPKEEPKSAIAVLDNSLADLNQRPLPPEVRTEANTMIDKAKSMIANPKGYKGLSDADKKIYDDYQERVKKIIANAPPVPPPPAPPTQTTMGGGMRMPSWMPRRPQLELPSMNRFLP